MCYCPPVYEICPNHEVVMFQPRTVTTPKPRLRRLLLHSLLFETPHPLLLPFDVLPEGAVHSCLASPSTDFRLVAARDHLPTQASPVSVPAYQEPLASPSPVAFRVRLLLHSLAPATPAGFLSPPLHCCHQNIF